MNPPHSNAFPNEERWSGDEKGSSVGSSPDGRKHSRAGGVCFLMESFFPVIHGGTTQILAVGERLAERGFEPLMITRRISRDHPAREKLRGIDVLRMEPVVGLHRTGKFLMLPGTLLGLIRQRRRYDVIVVCDLKVLGVVGVIAAQLLRKSCVLRMESCGELDITGWLSANRSSHPFFSRLVQLLDPLRRRLLGFADRFLSISSAITSELRRCRIPDNKIVEITNGVDTAHFSPLSESPTRLRNVLGLPDGRLVVYTGRLAIGKGLPWLLEVWKGIAFDFSDAYLILVGSGQGFGSAIEEQLRQTVREAELEHRVVFVGDSDSVVDYLRASDIFVLPSQTEALGISLLEAMACGLPVVASAVGGILDVVEDHVDGLLVEYGDNNALREAITRLLDSNELAEQLGSKARQKVLDKFEIGAIVDRYVEMFSQLRDHQAS